MTVQEGAPILPTPDRGINIQKLLRAGLATATLGLTAIIGVGETASAAAGETSVTPRCAGEQVVLDTSFYNDPDTYGVTLDSVGAQYLEFSTGTSVAEDLPSGETGEVSYSTGHSSVAGGQVEFSIVALGGDFTDTAQASYDALDCDQVTTTTSEATTTTSTTEVPTSTSTSTTTSTTEVPTSTSTSTTTSTTEVPASTSTSTTSTTEVQPPTSTSTSTTTTTRPGITTSTTEAPGTSTTQQHNTTTTGAPQAPASGPAPANAIPGAANFTG